MEKQVLPIVENFMNILREYENQTNRRLSEYEKSVEIKDNLIKTKDELNKRLTEEMNDFLKVSFASKCVNKVEELEIEIKKHESKNEELQRTNKQLNGILDNLTKKNFQDTSTQTDDIHITTKKGNYVIIENELRNASDMKTIGQINSKK